MKLFYVIKNSKIPKMPIIFSTQLMLKLSSHEYVAPRK